MKNEHALNSSLSKGMNYFSPNLKHVKISDKYSIGISDFLLWMDGESAAMEVKFIKDYPKRGGTKLLSHPFSGVQLSFLHEIDATKNGGYGLVGVDSERRMYIIPYWRLPEEGNWTKDSFKHEEYMWYDFKDIDGLLNYIF